jgi:hypothetical protein
VKLSVDVKFLTTAAATFVLIVAAVAALNALAGTAPASVGAAVLGAIAIKLFDKLDYNPSFSLELGAPRISVPWTYSAIASVFIVYGCSVIGDIVVSMLKRTDPAAYPCRLWEFTTIGALDWGGFLLAGWLVGRLFPQRALALSSISAFVLILAFLLEGHAPEKLDVLGRCFVGPNPSPEDLESARSGMQTGMVIGVVVRGYLVITMARIASRRPRANAAA